MRPSVHPDCSILFVSADRFVNRDETVGDRISLFPDPHRERSPMDVFDDVNLALMFRKRETTGPEGQPPLAGVVVDGKTDKVDECRPWSTLGFVFLIRTWRSPQASQIQLSEGRNAFAEENAREEERRERLSPREIVGHARQCRSNRRRQVSETLTVLPARYGSALVRPRQEGFLFPFDGESVSHTVYGLHIRRFLGMRLDLFANTANVDIDASRSDGAIIAPDAIQQMVS